MARTQRQKGSLVDPMRTSWLIERQAKERADAIATRAGISTSALIEAVIEHIELTDQGLPTWMPPRDRDGELPIDAG